MTAGRSLSSPAVALSRELGDLGLGGENKGGPGERSRSKDGGARRLPAGGGSHFRRACGPATKMADEATRRAVSEIPVLRTNGGPRDQELWVQRLKEEYQALIRYVENNKNADNDWFRLESNKEGTRWFGKCWFIHDLLKYEFDLEFDIPVTYPGTAPEIAIPELDGKTAKMYRGGKICLTDHFKPLWARNVPKFGLAHLMALGLGPWLAVEIPDLIQKGLIQHKEK
ncbi:ubiquitin-fold modifier-conjugating enzyme 1 [Ornithorhynchus anatinus]|uniref:Ubiquitin-fold modifier-conjugating enzyme 1 n=1 Tax=Ornithorhynchus anatinus TaxID=9258 RepID=A0A6I8PBL1_ORNAN|nr:ubiquitin-fold modifier-conjugating enzyme 1 [Ornithorhynchus anatinus]